MKKIYYFLFFVIVLSSGCNDGLLDTRPLDGIGSNFMWETSNDADLGVAAIYNAVRLKEAFLNYGLNDGFTPIAFIMNSGSSFDEYRQYKFCINTATSSESIFKQKWSDLYKGVVRANDAIANLPKIEAIDSTKRETLLAESKFLRALFYFELLSFYSGHDKRDPGVPLYIEPANYEDAYLPRSNPGQIRALMIHDLEDAIPHLPFTAIKGRTNQVAARMLLGKVYLYNGDWLKASNVFGGIISNNNAKGNPYQLYSDYGKLFQLAGEDNKESIFVISNLPIQDYGGWADLLYSNRSGNCAGTNTLIPTTYLVDSYQKKDGSDFDWTAYKAANPAFSWDNKTEVDKLFATRDPRLEASIIRPWGLFVGTSNKTFEFRPTYDAKIPPAVAYECMRTSNSSNDHYGWRKFVNVGNETTIRRSSPTDWIIMRYADLLLLFAEAKNEAEGPTDSVHWAIDQIRQRPNVNMPKIKAGISQDDMRISIRNERAWELAGEGHRYGDYRRWYKYDPTFDMTTLNHVIKGFRGNPVNPQGGTRVFEVRNWQFAIPQSEIDLNPYLEPQNTGWEN